MTLRVAIGGDVCPINRNELPMRSGNWSAIWGDIADFLRGTDLAIANLECPLVDNRTPLLKSGPALSVSTACASSLREAGFAALGMANNHIMDQGPNGLHSTLAACAATGIATFGAGNHLKAALKPLIVSVAGVRLAFIGLADNERCLATVAKPGAAPLDAILFVRTVREYRRDFDKLIVLVHGGNEGYPYPSPGLRDMCRFLIEEGSSVVVCQHSHSIGCHEEYLGGYIVYGQGNLLFDYADHGRPGREGLMILLTIGETTGVNIDFLPVTQCEGEVGVRMASPNDANRILAGFVERSNEINKKGFVEEMWGRFCEERHESYLGYLLGFGLFRSLLNRRGRLVSVLYEDSAILKMENLIQCRAQREALLTILDHEIAGRSRKVRKNG